MTKSTRTMSLPRMMKLADVAERLGVNKKTLVIWARDPLHTFPEPYKLGHCWYVNEAEVSEWLQTRQPSHQDRVHDYRSRIATEDLYAP